MSINLKNIAIIMAAGQGTRLSDKHPKQYFKINDQTLLEISINKFLSHPKIDAVIAVISENQEDLYNQHIQPHHKLLKPAYGGKERQDSVRLALEHIAEYNPKTALIHDAARIMLNPQYIDPLLESLEHKAASCLVTPAADTTRYISYDNSKIVSRENMFSTQTPQAFHYKLIKDLHHKFKDTKVTDDIALLELDNNHKIDFINAPMSNFKVTTKEDYELAKKIMTNRSKPSVIAQEQDHFEEHNDEAISCNNKPVIAESKETWQSPTILHKIATHSMNARDDKEPAKDENNCENNVENFIVRGEMTKQSPTILHKIATHSMNARDDKNPANDDETLSTSLRGAKQRGNLMNYGITKVGFGFDAHKFKEATNKDSKIMLCGIAVPCKYEIIAHSDGDVALHALTDALLGSIGAGDIGQHFPPSDNQWKNASSDQFVKFAAKLLKEKNARINNVDITIISETPRVDNHRQEMKNSIAEMLEIDLSDVNIKATTTEGMGFTGRREGIACKALISIVI